MRRTIQAGNVVETYTFRVHRNTKKRSARKKGASLPRQQDANERDAVKRLARLINANYHTGDLFLTAEYLPEKLYPMVEEAEGNIDRLNALANAQMKKFLRRMKYELGKLGHELKCIPFSSDMDGDTGEIVNPHHHIIISSSGFRWVYKNGERVLCIGEKPIDDIWGKGHVEWKPLQRQKDYSRLAAYLMRQVRRIPDGKKYSPTRNHIKPRLVKEELLIYSPRRLQPPKGAKVEYADKYEPGMPQYIRYTISDKSGNEADRENAAQGERAEEGKI